MSSADRPQDEASPITPASPDARLDGESATAFLAFQIYRDLGASRSLELAWHAHAAGRGKAPTKCPGCWNRWSVKYEWLRRATAFDAQIDAFKLAARLDRIRRLEEQRGEYEFQNQTRLEKRVARMEAVLDKADAAPITDVTQAKDETERGRLIKTKTKIKGINFAGYARLVHEANETAKQAITGVRVETKGQQADNKTVQEVAGLVWDKAPPA